MSGKENSAQSFALTLGRGLSTWLLTALILLLLFSFVISLTATSSRSMAYGSAALSFLAAAAAGLKLRLRHTGARLLAGLLCSAIVVAVSLLLGLLLDRDGLRSDSVLSVVSFTLAGMLFGSFVAQGGRCRGGDNRFRAVKRRRSKR